MKSIVKIFIDNQQKSKVFSGRKANPKNLESDFCLEFEIISNLGLLIYGFKGQGESKV